MDANPAPPALSVNIEIGGQGGVLMQIVQIPRDAIVVQDFSHQPTKPRFFRNVSSIYFLRFAKNGLCIFWCVYFE